MLYSFMFCPVKKIKKKKRERKIKDSRKKRNDKVIEVGGAQNAEKWLKMKKRGEKTKNEKK